MTETGHPQERINMARARAIVGLSTRVMQQMAEAGEIPSAIKIRRCWTFNQLVLQGWVAEKGARPAKPRRSEFSWPRPITKTSVPPLLEGQAGHVYVIGFGKYVKIGWSRTVAQRIEEVQEGVPERLLVYALLPGSMMDERNLHRRFADYRLNGEWFHRRDELRVWTLAGCPR